MSTQTGIRANDELKQFFAKCRGENRTKYRMIKVVIANEELTLDMSKEASGDWKQDWDKLVLRSIENDDPCYLLYRYLKALLISEVYFFLKSIQCNTKSFKLL